jgi:hypothetical protein
MKQLHPIQQALLDKYGLKHQLGKLIEELAELHYEILVIVGDKKGIDYNQFIREFLDVRNLMQQIESKLDPRLLEQYEAEMFEKAKTKYLD